MSIKVGMVSLGCSKNLVDSEKMLYKIKQKGYAITAEAGLADVVIINTCGFIQASKEEAIDTILEFAKLKEEGQIKRIIVTGCLSERYKEETAKLFPEADAVIGIGEAENITDIIEKVMGGETVCSFPSKLLLPLEGKRIISTLPFFAYLKIAEGCSNCCSYCAIPSIRGKFRSMPMEDVIDEAKWLAGNGVTELIVIAQDTTRYGEDLYGESKLPKLLQELCKIESLKWIRVLYCYPERITDELIDVIANEDKIVKYLDIPVQHCNDEILKNMNRPSTHAKLSELFKKLRERVPEITLRTTLITGFPGETDEQFTELAEFVKETKFDRLGCFAYSAEENTKAAEMDGQIDDDIKNHRADVIMEQQNRISEAKNESMLGKIVEAVVEGFDKWAECYFGRTAKDAPDIDGKIFFDSITPLKMGDYVKVEITETLDYDLVGQITD